MPRATPAPKVSFEEWKRKVNQSIENIIGLSSDELPDIDYYNMWEDECSPREAAREAIQGAME